MVGRELQRESVATLNISPVVEAVVHTVGGTTQLVSVTHRVQPVSEESVVEAPDQWHTTTGLGQELVMVSQTRVAVAVEPASTATQIPSVVMAALES
jgi:hypothetical protein